MCVGVKEIQKFVEDILNLAVKGEGFELKQHLQDMNQKTSCCNFCRPWQRHESWAYYEIYDTNI